MENIGYSLSLRDVLVIFVVGVFQFQMTSITSKLNNIEDTLVQELVEMERIKTVQANQEEDVLFLRKELGEMDEKLSRHITDRPLIKL